MNEMYWQGLNKGKRRELASIRFLIEIDLTQPKLLEKVEYFLGEEIGNKKFSNVLKKLEQNGIVKKEPLKKEGKGANPNLVFIPKDHSTLKKLIKYLYSIDDVPLLLLVKRYFIHSKYPRDVINLDLVLEIELNLENVLNKYSSIDFAFKEEERQLILQILKNSPSALNYAINLYSEDLIQMLNFKKLMYPRISAEKLRKELKEHFIFKLQAYLGEDISINGSYNPIIYITTTEFLQVMEKELTKDYTWGIRLLSPEIEENRIKRTIRTRIKRKVPD